MRCGGGALQQVSVEPMILHVTCDLDIAVNTIHGLTQLLAPSPLSLCRCLLDVAVNLYPVVRRRVCHGAQPTSRQSLGPGQVMEGRCIDLFRQVTFMHVKKYHNRHHCSLD